MSQKKGARERGARNWWPVIAGISGFAVLLLCLYVGSSGAWALLGTPVAYVASSTSAALAKAPAQTLDTNAYNLKLLQLAHLSPPNPWYYAFLDGTSTPMTAQGIATTTNTVKPLWPVRTTYPEAGPIFPFNRVVAYYGNFYSTAMGVLGEYPTAQVEAMLASTTQEWRDADPSTPVIPAIDYIAVTAQGTAGSDGMYRARMPASQIQKALDMANDMHGLLILDIQVGKSNVQTEIPLLKQWLAYPNVELAIDPEFSMKDGARPGVEIGTYDASDVNWVAHYMAQIVQQNGLPPKFLIVHRFTQDMVTNYQNIKPLPQVQIVMDMDGWGFPAKKVNTYEQVIEPEPVQFTGFKLFYKADLLGPGGRLMTTQEVLALTPSPVFIQYQ